MLRYGWSRDDTIFDTPDQTRGRATQIRQNSPWLYDMVLDHSFGGQQERNKKKTNGLM